MITKIDDQNISIPQVDKVISIRELITTKDSLQKDVDWRLKRIDEINAQLQEASDLGVASAVEAVKPVK